ncbi:MAG: hypothetical protein VKO64_09570 [Candidatus Sericytochromatia bacterium]|nr:hypothetical protein [Candidatus Sericytochromatia bacterium]
MTIVLLLFPPVPVRDMERRALNLDVAGTTIQVAGIEGLIRLKVHAGRPIDLADIAHLRRLQQP